MENPSEKSPSIEKTESATELKVMVQGEKSPSVGGPVPETTKIENDHASTTPQRSEDDGVDASKNGDSPRSAIAESTSPSSRVSRESSPEENCDK